MKNFKFSKITLILAAIIILAFILRIFNISHNPPSVYGDEISFAWNAWSILHTGADEYGISYPLQFKAFNDYKSPIPVYLLVPVFALFGMNTFSVRLPVVIVSVLTVAATYFLVKELFIQFAPQREKIRIEILSLLTAFLLAISPWHIHLSRGYFEATLALFPFILGSLFFIKAFKKPNFFYASSVSFAASLYTYFSPRMLLLIFLPFIFFYFRKAILKQKKPFIKALIVFTLISLPLVKLALFDQGGNRLSWLLQSRLEKSAEEATVELTTAGGPLLVRKALHNRYGVFVSKIANDYLEHFSLNFWYLFGDNSLRYFLGKMGMFHLIELPFFLIGLYFFLRKDSKIAGFLLGWLLLAPLPAALVGRSFAVRSIAMLPVPFVFVSYGIVEAFSYIKRKSRQLYQLSAVLIVMGFAVSLGRYTLIYHLDYPRYASTWWGWENKAAIDYARKRENQYDTIFISDFYTGAPLAYAFYTEYSPEEFRRARENPITVADERHVVRLGKYNFGSLDLDQKRVEAEVIPPKTLYIGRPEEADGQETIVAPDDGRVLFKIHYTD